MKVGNRNDRSRHGRDHGPAGVNAFRRQMSSNPIANGSLIRWICKVTSPASIEEIIDSIIFNLKLIEREVAKSDLHLNKPLQARLTYGHIINLKERLEYQQFVNRR